MLRGRHFPSAPLVLWHRSDQFHADSFLLNIWRQHACRRFMELRDFQAIAGMSEAEGVYLYARPISQVFGVNWKLLSTLSTSHLVSIMGVLNILVKAEGEPPIHYVATTKRRRMVRGGGGVSNGRSLRGLIFIHSQHSLCYNRSIWTVQSSRRLTVTAFN